MGFDSLTVKEMDGKTRWELSPDILRADGPPLSPELSSICMVCVPGTWTVGAKSYIVWLHS